jgi:trimeric autotransporter adhesin
MNPYARLLRLFSVSPVILFVTLVSLMPQAWAVATTATTLAVTSGSSAVTTVPSGSAVELTATVTSSGLPVTTGEVLFCDATAAHCTDIHLLGAAQLTSAGTAAFRFYPGIGTHSYKAVFVGTPNGLPAYQGSTSSTAALAVTGTFATTTTLAQSGAAGNYTLTATVTALANSIDLAAPAGTVSFLDTTNGNLSLGTADLGAGTAGPSLFTSSTPATNPYPQSVTVADFNGDGKLDLAVPVYSIATPAADMNILLGNGDGTFTAGPAFPLTGQNVNNAVAADFNGDGIPDLALSLPDANQVQVLLGNGSGGFTAKPAISVNHLYVLATGDLNQDGKPDLITANCGLGTITILLGNGDGTFTTSGSPSAGGCASAIGVGDFNGDGIPDLALAISSGVDGVPGFLTILLGNGNGTFTAVAGNPATGNAPFSIAVGDFNGDGILDLAVANMNPPVENLSTVTILIGNGNGTFTPTAVSPVTGELSSSISIGDFNGDGKADLVTANAGSNTVTMLLGNGDGTFSAPVSSAAGTNSLFAAVGDFNGDGLTDVAAANNTPNTVTVLLSQLTETATATANGIALIGSGMHQANASYPGDSLYSASTSSTVGLTAQQVKPTLTVTPATSSLTTAASLSVVVTVSGGGTNPTPTGTVTLSSGSYTSAATSLSGGSATVVIPPGSLTTGSDTLMVNYSGDANYTAATGSAAVTVSVPPGFALSSTAVNIAPGASTANTSTITVTPAGGFTGSVTLTATVTSSPASAQDAPTLSFGTTSPVSITGASAGTATLTVSTTASSQTTCTAAIPLERGVPWYGVGGTALACVLLLGFPARRRSWQTMLGAVVFLAVLTSGVVACSGGSATTSCTPVVSPGTTSGTYTVTVTGTSGTTTATSTITLAVQ